MPTDRFSVKRRSVIQDVVNSVLRRRLGKALNEARREQDNDLAKQAKQSSKLCESAAGIASSVSLRREREESLQPPSNGLCSRGSAEKKPEKLADGEDEEDKQTEDKGKKSNCNRQRIGNLRISVTHIRFAIPTCMPGFTAWQVQRSRSPARAFHRIKRGNRQPGSLLSERLTTVAGTVPALKGYCVFRPSLKELRPLFRAVMSSLPPIGIFSVQHIKENDGAREANPRKDCNDHFHESDTELHGYKRTRGRRKLRSPFNPTNGLACLVDAEEPRIHYYCATGKISDICKPSPSVRSYSCQAKPAQLSPSLPYSQGPLLSTASKWRLSHSPTISFRLWMRQFVLGSRCYDKNSLPRRDSGLVGQLSGLLLAPCSVVLTTYTFLDFAYTPECSSMCLPKDTDRLAAYMIVDFVENWGSQGRATNSLNRESLVMMRTVATLNPRLVVLVGTVYRVATFQGSILPHGPRSLPLAAVRIPYSVLLPTSAPQRPREGRGMRKKRAKRMQFHGQRLGLLKQSLRSLAAGRKSRLTSSCSSLLRKVPPQKERNPKRLDLSLAILTLA
ncbi:hypothetical protein CCUS01_13947 [Colletotrichum cuscutae]|uniref:Uncharacterized protein n=1 Tax=Colletotrichum cuscutae TaxID=1209917 RepID=A0AAI9YA69_9PEZI|nr:hypothetical protein CCUS01_13947 [Colletotrichum cuscutae]